MKRPPMIVTFQARNHDGSGRRVNLWIPLFIIVPIVLLLLFALLLIALPFFILYEIFTWDFRWWPGLKRGAPALLGFTNGLPGLKVDVENEDKKMYIDVK